MKLKGTTRRTCCLLLVSVWLLALVVPPPGFGCTIQLVWKKMPQAFRVVVSGSGEPVPSISVVVTSWSEDPSIEGAEVRKGLTNSDGVLEVEGLQPGKYVVWAGQETALGGAAFIEVTDTSIWRLPKVLDLQWPEDRVLVVRRLAGVLHWRVGAEGTETSPVEGGTLNVKEAGSGREIGTVTVGSDGSFDAGDLANGLYAVKLLLKPNRTKPASMPLSMWERERREGMLPVLIQSDQVAMPRVRLSLSYTSCGMDFQALPMD